MLQDSHFHHTFPELPQAGLRYPKEPFTFHCSAALQPESWDHYDKYLLRPRFQHRRDSLWMGYRYMSSAWGPAPKCRPANWTPNMMCCAAVLFSVMFSRPSHKGKVCVNEQIQISANLEPPKWDVFVFEHEKGGCIFDFFRSFCSLTVKLLVQTFQCSSIYSRFHSSLQVWFSSVNRILSQRFWGWGRWFWQMWDEPFSSVWQLLK